MPSRAWACPPAATGHHRHAAAVPLRPLIEEDLIEEVVRIIGYDNLPTTPPLAPITAKLPPESRRSRFAVRRLLAALGYQETINFSFVEAHWEKDLAGNADPIRC
jgi:phenylalanyl-tRNA synthetase beta chain